MYVFKVLVLAVPLVAAGPIAYGVRQAGCAAVVTACYTAAGELMSL